MEPSARLLNEVARRLGDLGVTDADRKAYGIATAAIRLAVPEALEQVARARRASELTVRRSRQELASLPSLRYALALYAGGLDDGGRFARQTLRREPAWDPSPTMARPSVPTGCPCGSGETYAACCRRLHRGRRSGRPTAPTALRLMRSRFSAFALGDPAYLLASWHPSTRPPSLDLPPGLEWSRLEIVATTAGGEQDRSGTVEFVAHHRDARDGRRGQQHERSVFVREGGQWFYVGAMP